jgi:HSP20 family protein
MPNTLTRWDPFNDTLSLRDAVKRLFEDSFIRPDTWLTGWEGQQLGIAVDVVDTQEDIVVTASVPGLKPEDLDISLTGDTLTIKGELKVEQKVEEANYVRRERRYGSFQRTLSLPTMVQADKAKAEFENGVLTLTLPKAEEVKPKTIKVKAK